MYRSSNHGADSTFRVHSYLVPDLVSFLPPVGNGSCANTLRVHSVRKRRWTNAVRTDNNDTTQSLTNRSNRLAGTSKERLWTARLPFVRRRSAATVGDAFPGPVLATTRLAATTRLPVIGVTAGRAAANPFRRTSVYRRSDGSSGVSGGDDVGGGSGISGGGDVGGGCDGDTGGPGGVQNPHGRFHGDPFSHLLPTSDVQRCSANFNSFLFVFIVFTVQSQNL